MSLKSAIQLIILIIIFVILGGVYLKYFSKEKILVDQTPQQTETEINTNLQDNNNKKKYESEAVNMSNKDKSKKGNNIETNKIEYEKSEEKKPENSKGDHTVEINLDRVRISENFSIDDVQLVFLDGPKLPKFLDAEAHYKGGVIKASSLPSNPPVALISATNFGRLLDAMGITSAAEAGTALLTLEENENANLKISFKADEFDFKKTAIRNSLRSLSLSRTTDTRLIRRKSF